MFNSEIQKLAVEWIAVGQLLANPRNSRVHSDKQIHQIARSIEQFGFNNPILVDASRVIIAGHGRVEAAKSLRLDQVPTIRLDHLSPAQKRAYVIADNKLALNAGWDPEILATELQNLSVLDLEFDLEITGFETAEIELMVDGLAQPAAEDSADRIPNIEATVVSQPGDLWLLGNHKILCADARDRASFARLMNTEKARAMFGDAPYNVRIDGHVGGLGAIKHREFAMASGEMTEAQFNDFLRQTLINAARLSIDGAIHFVCMDWRHVSELIGVGKEVYSELKNICVWNKDNGGMGSFYRSKHELVCVFKVGTAPHINNIELGRTGRYRTNVWDYAGVNTMRAGRLADLAMHPTIKPVALVIDALKDCTRPKDIVLDPFCGSGTTIVAAEKSGRIARAIEIDPGYVDLAIRRWETLTGRQAFHSAHQETFGKLAQVKTEAPGAMEKRDTA